MLSSEANVHVGTAASGMSTQSHRTDADALPMFLTVDETADLLRTSAQAIYAMVARSYLPGVVRVRRRILVRRDDLLHWLRQKSTLSPERLRR